MKAQLRQRSSFKAMLTRMDGMLSFETSGIVTKVLNLPNLKPFEFRDEHKAVQVLCLSANIHVTQKVEKYMQNGQLLQLKSDLPFNLIKICIR